MHPSSFYHVLTLSNVFEYYVFRSHKVELLRNKYNITVSKFLSVEIELITDNGHLVL